MLNNCLEWDKRVKRTYTLDSGWTHLFYAGRQSVVWRARSFIWSRL